MPLNLIKTYNSLLELDAFDEEERNASLMGIFKRDFVDSGNYFRQKKVLPTFVTREKYFIHFFQSFGYNGKIACIGRGSMTGIGR